MKIANIRKDAVQKATSEIVKTKRPALIMLENLNVKGMVKNHCLAKSVHDATMRQFRTTIEYKQAWAGWETGYADRWYASSKTCSDCGALKEDLTLGDRIFVCPNAACGLVKDRDWNAAINIGKYTVSSTGINGRGVAKVHAARQVGDDETTIKETAVCGSFI